MTYSFRNSRMRPAARRLVPLALAAGALALAPSAMARRAPAAPVAAAPVPAGPWAGQVQPELVRQAGGDVYTFYATRDYRPLWLDARGTPNAAAATLIELLDSAAYDGLDPATLDVAGLKAALGTAATSGNAAEVSRAELALSRAFVIYAQALRAASGAQVIYEHDNLRPQALRPYHLLQAAAAAPSVDDYVGQMQWMHPLYAPLRRGLTPALAADPRARAAVMNSLTRIRGIPVTQRQVIVDVASARLWMYENGRPVDSMKVVVGRATDRTPMLAGYVRYAIVNPYWNVPSELVTKTIATNVLKRGPGYLAGSGYQVLSDWTDAATLVDPKTLDWNAAARGTLDLRVRQLPRPGNAMGKVKYEFPNQYGIYLHDTPQKDLMLKDARQFSAGCIRLEDAARLGRWLMRGQAMPVSSDPETRVDLPQPVPIYLTYLTAHAGPTGIALGPDPYGFDAAGQPALAIGDAETGKVSR